MSDGGSVQELLRAGAAADVARWASLHNCNKDLPTLRTGQAERQAEHISGSLGKLDS
jgi:hypothetical protein